MVVTVEVAPWVLWLEVPHSAEDEAYLLGVMSSIPLDWWSRRFVEGHVDQEAFNCLRVPDPRQHAALYGRVVELAGRLAAQDDRFADWAQKIGVRCGNLKEDEKQDMIHELDSAVTHLYGLNESQLRHIFETFHEGWEYEERMEATLAHFKKWQIRL